MKRTNRIVGFILALVIVASAMVMITSAATKQGGTPYLSDGRYCQDYAMTAKIGWDYTTSDGSVGVKKMYKNRNFAVEVKVNSYTTYSTAFAVFLADSDAVAYTETRWIKGTGGNDGAYTGAFRDGEKGCLGIRSDARATRTYPVSGIWSPDMYK